MIPAKKVAKAAWYEPTITAGVLVKACELLFQQ